MKSALQLTVALLKPDIAGNPRLVNCVEKRILENNFHILKRRTVRWQKSDSEAFYRQHTGKFFHRRLVESMSSGEIIALLLAKENAILDWRKLIGPTKVYKTRFTDPESIRGTYGLTDTRNTVHGSDSPESVEEEAKFFFPGLDKMRLLKDFQTSKPIYNKEKGFHEMDFSPQESQTEKLCSNLGDKEAWSEYYATTNAVREWFVDYTHIKDILSEIIQQNPVNQSVLDIGCGTSEIGADLVKEHPHLSVYCVDSSLECLTLRSRKFSDSRCTFVVGDICKKLPFADSSMHLIIDKGTSDTVLRHKQGKESFLFMISEVFRVLHPCGKYVQVTTEPPETRLEDLENISPSIEISHREIEIQSNMLPVFVYCIKKSKN